LQDLIHGIVAESVMLEKLTFVDVAIQRHANNGMKATAAH
jgi:hypothetical protein